VEEATGEGGSRVGVTVRDIAVPRILRLGSLHRPSVEDLGEESNLTMFTYIHCHCSLAIAPLLQCSIAHLILHYASIVPLLSFIFVHSLTSSHLHGPLRMCL